MGQPIIKSIIIAVYTGCLMPIIIFSFRKPSYNWDMLAYMAIVIKASHKEPQVIHQLTYSIAQKEVPAIQYELLTGGTHREMLSTNPDEFYQRLPFYAVKPFYNGLVYLFYKMDFSLSKATVLPSILSYLLIGLLLLSWLSKYLGNLLSLGVSLLIMYSGMMIHLARISTPDCLSTLFLFSAFYFILERASFRWMMIFLILAILTRLNNIIPSFIVLSFFLLVKNPVKQIKPQQYVLLLLGLVVSYFFVTSFVRSFGWGMLYYFEFARHIGPSHEYQSSFSFSNYSSQVVSAIIAGLLYHNLALFILLLLLLLYSPSFHLNKLNFGQSFSLLFPLIILIHFILFPDLDSRFFAAYYLCIVVLLGRRVYGFRNYKP